VLELCWAAEKNEDDEEEGEGAITCMARAQLREREEGRPGQGWAMDWEPHGAQPCV